MSEPMDHPDQALHSACDLLEGSGYPETAKALDAWATTLKAERDDLRQKLDAAVGALQSIASKSCVMGTDYGDASIYELAKSAIAAAKGGE